MTTISSTVLQKTGTKVTKKVQNASWMGMKNSLNCLETTVEYASNSPMVEKFGITKMIKWRRGNSVRTAFERKNGDYFHIDHNIDGKITDYSDRVYPLLGSNVKETLKNILNALNFAK